MKDILGKIGEEKIKSFLLGQYAFDATHIQPCSAYKILNHNVVCEGTFVNDGNKHGWVILYNDGSVTTSTNGLPNLHTSLDANNVTRLASRKLIKFMMSQCETRREKRVLFSDLVSNAKEEEKVNGDMLRKNSQLRQRKIVTLFNEIYNRQSGEEIKK